MATLIKLDKLETKKFVVDAIEVSVEDQDAKVVTSTIDKLKESVKVIDSLEKENEEMKKAIDVKTAEFDHAKNENETLKKQIADAKEKEQASISAKVGERLDLELIAAYANIPEADRKVSNDELKVKIIKQKVANFDATGKSNDYIQARYDAVKDDIVKENNNNLSVAKLIVAVDNVKNDGVDNQQVDHRTELLKKLNDLNKR